MAAKFVIEVIKKVRYGVATQTIDETYVYDSEAEFAEGVYDRAGKGLRVHYDLDGNKVVELSGFDQIRGWRTMWRPVNEGEVLFQCRCGLCHRPVKREGGFKPGHDAVLVAKLLHRVRDRRMTAADALADLTDRPKLQAKLSRLLAD